MVYNLTASREETLDAELSAEQERDAARIRFAELATSLREYVDTTTAEVGSMSGSLDDQLARLLALKQARKVSGVPQVPGGGAGAVTRRTHYPQRVRASRAGERHHDEDQRGLGRAGGGRHCRQPVRGSAAACAVLPALQVPLSVQTDGLRVSCCRAATRPRRSIASRPCGRCWARCVACPPCAHASACATPCAVGDVSCACARWVQVLEQAEESLRGQIMAQRDESITPEQYKEMKEVFEFFDQDGDDNLNPAEFHSCVTGIGVIMTDEEVRW